MIPTKRQLIDLMKENSFTFKNIRSRQYPAETITKTDYADNLVLLANTSAQASTIHRLHLCRRIPPQ